MIHINYFIQKNLNNNKTSKHFEISDTNLGIDYEFSHRKQYKEVQILRSIDDVLKSVQNIEQAKADIRFDVPQELPHVEMVRSHCYILNTRQDLNNQDIMKILRTIERYRDNH